MEDAIAKVALKSEETEDICHLVGFEVSNELFGVDILMVQEILKDTTVTAIPDAPEFIVGIVNLRGNIIPILNLKKRLKLTGQAVKENDDEVWIVILNIGERVTGFVVDRVTKVLKVPVKNIKPPPELMVSEGLDSDYIRGVCKHGQQLLAILDFHKILLVEEFKRISAANKRKV
jgi:purine-binding chemotaxis protein CheW